ncbi:hypothetical protein [Kineococcus sp. SYSU DK005]|uniref:hypothetical protein n=1 Tax=Kineococcus sp. SYSU DK005 TaxID=3383126 RepID=UPI003D7CBC50
MRWPATATAALLGTVLLGGCTQARSVPPVPPPPPPAPPVAPADLRVATVDSRREGAGPTGAPVVTWSVDWQLSWAPVAGASSYAVRYASAEGVPRGSSPDETTTATTVRVTAAAGSSAPERYGTERAAGLLFTSSQLLVSVAAVARDGTSGPATGWIPVGDVPADGRPLTTTPHDHGPGRQDGHGDEAHGHEEHEQGHAGEEQRGGS